MSSMVKWVSNRGNCNLWSQQQPVGGVMNVRGSAFPWALGSWWLFWEVLQPVLHLLSWALMNFQQHLGFDGWEIFETKLSSGCPSDTMVLWKQGQIQWSLKNQKNLQSDCLVCSWIVCSCFRLPRRWSQCWFGGSYQPELDIHKWVCSKLQEKHRCIWLNYRDLRWRLPVGRGFWLCCISVNI